jgi:hypothetical protein
MRRTGDHGRDHPTDRSPTDDQLEAMATQLDSLARHLRQLKLDPSSRPRATATSSAAFDRSASPTPPSSPTFQKGDCVQITHRDGYHGRRGTLTSRHGRLFWNIQLDATDKDKARLIYKKDTSLALIEA